MRPQTKFSISLGLAGFVGVLLFVIGMLRNGSFDYWYLPANLVLGLIPLLATVLVRKLVGRRGWNDWRVIPLAVVWLLFLPNSFYIVTDFIHLPEVARVDMVQDVVMLMQFSVVGLAAGFTSLYMMHTMLLKRLGTKRAMAAAIGVLYLCSFAIYLGRVLRWNSWDVVLHPFSIAGDALFLWWDPVLGEGAFWMTVSFFMMLVSLYLVVWCGVKKQALPDR